VGRRSILIGPTTVTPAAMQAASLPRASRLVPVLLVLLAIVSVQVGASIAKSLFPAWGPPAPLRCAWPWARRCC